MRQFPRARLATPTWLSAAGPHNGGVGLRSLGVNLAVGLDMVFGSLFGMFQRARVMAVSQMSVVARSLVETLIMMTGGFAMMDAQRARGAPLPACDGALLL